MTSFYNLSKADPAIADSGGVQFVGQRGPRSMVSVSASCHNRNSKPRHPRKRKLLRSLHTLLPLLTVELLHSSINKLNHLFRSTTGASAMRSTA